MTMVQQNFHFSTQAQYPSLGFVTAQENSEHDKQKEKTEAKPWLGRLPAPSNNAKVTSRNLVLAKYVQELCLISFRK